jgi:hypothetical protein
MAQRLQDRLEDPGAAVYYEPGFRQIVEDHLTFLRSHDTTESSSIRPRIANACHGDFYCVLSHYNIPREFHWINLRINGLTSPLDYDSSMNQMLLCSPLTIKRLVKMYRANRRQAKKARGE